MDAKMLDEIARMCDAASRDDRLADGMLYRRAAEALKEYRDLLAAVEGSQDEIVRGLREYARVDGRPLIRLTQKAAAALVAMKAAKEKAEAERDGLLTENERIGDTRFLDGLRAAASCCRSVSEKGVADFNYARLLTMIESRERERDAYRAAQEKP